MKASPVIGFALLTLLGSVIASKSHHRGSKAKNNSNDSSPPVKNKYDKDSNASCKVTSAFNPSDLVDLHNTARAACSASEVQWDKGLAAAAQCWANRCRFEHSQTDDVGENIAAGSGDQYSYADGFAQWFDEYKLWRPGMGYDEATGHYTQIAWKGTRKVGCGVASCSSDQLQLGGDVPTAKFLVCQYYPAGNVIGDFKGEVALPPYNPIDKLVNSDKYQTQENKREGHGKGTKKKHRHHKHKHHKHKTHRNRATDLQGLHQEDAERA